EHEQVPTHPAMLEFANQFDHQPDEDRYARDQEPEPHRQIGGDDECHRHWRQLELEIVEDLLEGGHDLDHDERQDADGDRDHDARINKRAFDLAFESLGLFLEFGEALENDFQGAARLAGLDHIDV